MAAAGLRAHHLVTRDLLQHWRDEDRERRLFFCQIEAAETAIYLNESAEKTGDTKALNVIRAENAGARGGHHTAPDHAMDARPGDS